MAASTPPRAPYRCHVRGQLCDLRIASGSVENFISGSLVRNLNLGITPHPSPYNAGCGIGPSVRITTQSRVPITIGEYQEEVLCDVMEELSIADILLGRPWLYDNRVLYHGYEYQYVFYFKGARIVVAPEPTNDPDLESVAVMTVIHKVSVDAYTHRESNIGGV